VYKPPHIQSSLEKMVEAEVTMFRKDTSRYRITGTGQDVLGHLKETYKVVPRLLPEVAADLADRHDVLSRVIKFAQVIISFQSFLLATCALRCFVCNRSRP
jgi:hypothetical protein